jgi:hypothetical protein
MDQMKRILEKLEKYEPPLGYSNGGRDSYNGKHCLGEYRCRRDKKMNKKASR